MSSLEEIKKDKKAIEDKFNEILENDLRDFLLRHGLETRIYIDYERITTLCGDIIIKGTTTLKVQLG